MVYLFVLVWVANAALLIAAASEDDINYYVFTRQNQATDLKQRITIGDSGALSKSAYDGGKATKFLIHGWFGGLARFKSPWIKDLKDAILDLEDVNVIIVDWGKLARNPFYFGPARDTRFVGERTARLIEFLETETGTTRKNMHLIGHSLGGQVSGFAGKNLDPKPARISGLDTAGISFDANDIDDTLDPSDADFVDEIHTLLSHDLRGHADFFPNGGANITPIKIWEHMEAPKMFVASVKWGKCSYQSYACNDYNMFKNGCRSEDGNHMGYYAFKPAKHTDYYLDASIDAPCS